MGEASPLTSGRTWVVGECRDEIGAARGGGSPEDLRPPEVDWLRVPLAPFVALAGDRRTARLLDATIRGVIGSECHSRYLCYSG